jgi:hypothetical protein
MDVSWAWPSTETDSAEPSLAPATRRSVISLLLKQNGNLLLRASTTALFILTAGSSSSGAV